MLLLGRREQEKAFIDVPPSDTPTRIEVLVVDMQRGKVRLGFTAPRSVAIHREELLPQSRNLE